MGDCYGDSVANAFAGVFTSKYQAPDRLSRRARMNLGIQQKATNGYIVKNSNTLFVRKYQYYKRPDVWSRIDVEKVLGD